MKVLQVYYLNGNDNLIEDYYFEKEYRDDVMVRLNDIFYELYFFTSDALEFELTQGGYFSLPGLIVLEEISTKFIEKAIVNLEKRNYFNKLKGMDKFSPENRFIHNWYTNKLSLKKDSVLIKKIIIS